MGHYNIGPTQKTLLTFSHGARETEYTLIRSDRKTLEIAVHPDSSIVVKSPLNSELLLIEKKLRKRARWISQQLRYFQQFNPKTPDRRYISGETHLYLGRQYRLRVRRGMGNSVKLYKGFFQVTCQEESHPLIAKKLMENWYLQKAHIQFHESLDRCWPKFNAFALSKPSLSIKRMQKRWGSLSDKGIVTLNTELIRASKECIDYVVTHELCHLKYHDHSSEFYRLLGSIIPRWEETKHKLELSMV